MTGKIHDCSRTAPPVVLNADVCVVGSGCGGATAAWDLAAAGKQVLVLEEGPDLTGAALTQRDGEMYDQLYMDRGGRATDDLSITVLQGRALGGGGVINMSDVVPIPDAVLSHWQKRHGLTDFSPRALRPYAERALGDLSAQRIAESDLNRANRLLRDGAGSLGLRGEPMMHNRVGCEGLGTCLIGCPIDAKRNPRFVAIPKAVDAGATFLTRARAVRIEDGTSEIKRIVVRRLDARGYHEREAFEVRAPLVVVAANAVATPQLLLRSGLGNEHVGRNLMLQPLLAVLALFDEPIDPHEGIPQAYAVTEHEVLDHPEHGLWGFRIEAIWGTPGIVASLVPFTGLAGKEMMTRYRYAAASLLLVPDAPSGVVTVNDSGRPVIRYEPRDDLHARLRQAIEVAARIYLAAGAREVVVTATPPAFIRNEADLDAVGALQFPPATAAFLSAHQQGSVRFAPSPARGAADPTGKLYGARDIYVFDSSGFPSSASSHTMAPIITVAHYLTAQAIG